MTKTGLTRVWKVFRAIVSMALLLAVLIPAGIYVALSLPSVQNTIRNTAEKELSSLLGAPLRIGDVRVRPLSRLDLRDVALLAPESTADTIASIREVSVRFELYYFLHTRRIIVDYALIDGADVRLSRPTPEAPLNIQPVLDALKGDGKEKPPVHFDLRISNVALLDGRFSYDVLSAPRDTSGRFDPKHIEVENLELNAYIPRLSNDDCRVDIAHLSFTEKTGFELKGLKTRAEANGEWLGLNGLDIRLPATTIAFEPLKLAWKRFGDFKGALAAGGVKVRTRGINTISPADFQAFLPLLGDFPEVYSLELDATATPRKADVRKLKIFDATDRKSLDLQISALALAAADSISMPEIELRGLEAQVDGGRLVSRIPGVKADVRKLFETAGALSVSAQGHLAGSGAAEIDAELSTARAGGADIAAQISAGRGIAGRKLNFEASLRHLEAGALVGVNDLGAVSGELSGTIRLGGRNRIPEGKAEIDLSELTLRGCRLTDICILANYNGTGEGAIELQSNNSTLNAELTADFLTGEDGSVPALLLDARVNSFKPERLGMNVPHEGSDISARLHADLEGRNFDAMSGTITLSDFEWRRAAGAPLRLSDLTMEASPHSVVPFVKINSELLSGEIKGNISFASIVGDIRDMLGEALPALVAKQGEETAARNRFTYDFEIHDCVRAAEFFGFPVIPLYPVNISGYVNAVSGSASALIDAPYLRQGDKLISGTTVHAALDRASGRASAFVSGEMPTKKGPMQVDLSAMCVDNQVSTHADWTIRRTIPINGSIDLTGLLRREDEGGGLGVNVKMNPGSITFGDDLWQIRPSTIDCSKAGIRVEGFRLDTENQHISADGFAGPEESDRLMLNLQDVSLLPIFETLEIDKALIGGRATGQFTAWQVLSKEPRVSCPDLRVDSIGYNRCTLGNAHIAASWDNTKQAFSLDADIVEPEGGLHSRIWGDIYPATESLDINFDAAHVRVGFMQPFMEAFASDISGYASGQARLFGTFKEIDMTGRIFAEDLGINIDITNTRYFASDSIVLTPGRIDLKDITIRDRDGHTAKLGGYLTHTFFKEPVFDFRVTDAREFLCFNGTSKQNPDWYGTIYGNGGATIQGRPGVVDIGADMTTTAGSAFTFVLSDRLDAEEYSFITFRNATPGSTEDSLRLASGA
ncbi:MAG: AsmA family protein, partial [Muribaculaceae bacterium]|nr:AsmA family protein [Muribaculaceae bacterium]